MNIRFLTLLPVIFCLAPTISLAEGPTLSVEPGKQPEIDCVYANALIDAGVADHLANTRIVGLCGDPVPVGDPEPVVPVVPVLPTPFPWCNCPEDYTAGLVLALQAKERVVNPAFGAQDPIAALAEAYEVDPAQIVAPDFWSTGIVPEPEALRAAPLLMIGGVQE